MENRVNNVMIYDKYGSPNDVLKIIEDKYPIIKNPNEVIVKVIASALNPVDIKSIQGKMSMLISRPFPQRVGFDFSGIIEEIGSGVNNLSIGDEVYGDTGTSYCGSIAQYLCVDISKLGKKPKNISFIEAASIPLCALTGLQSLRSAGLKLKSINQQKSDENIDVAITAGSGGVGVYTIQIAKHMFHATNIVTSSSESKSEKLKELGATEVIDYHKESLAQNFKNNNKLFDAILVSTEESEELINFTKINKGGLISLLGPGTTKMLKKFIDGLNTQEIKYVNGFIKFSLSYFPTSLNWILGGAKMEDKAKSRGAHFETILTDPNTADINLITEYIEAGMIIPVIDSVYNFENWSDAFKRIESGRATGKVVIKIVSE